MDGRHHHGREFLISGLRQIAASKQKILAAERIGKHKTISQIVAVLVSLACLSLGEFGLQNTASRLLSRRIANLVLLDRPDHYSPFRRILFVKNAAIVNETLDGQPMTQTRDVATASVAAIEPIAEPVKVATPAFKEWEAIVEALGHGAQIVILRKGGIAEGRTGFQAKHPKFWLFPTGYHQQWEKTKPGLAPLRDAVARFRGEEKRIHAAIYCRGDRRNLSPVVGAGGAAGRRPFLGRGNRAGAFRLQGRPGMEKGLHLLIVRVSRINLPHRLPGLVRVRRLQVVDRGAD